MSGVIKAYEFLEKRLDSVGLKPVTDAFSASNAPSSYFDGRYLLQINKSTVDETGDKSLIVTHSFTLNILLSGWQRDLSSIKAALLRGENVIKKIVNPVGFVTDGVLAVTIGNYELVPFDEETNDDKMVFIAEVFVKNAICI